MCKFVLFIAAALIFAFSAAGTDLVLKNGKVYKNYRIKSIQNDKATVAYMAADGVPDIVEVSLNDLPDNIVSALGISAAVNTAGNAVQVAPLPENIVAQISLQLKKGLAAWPADDSKNRQYLICKAAENLKKQLAPYWSDAEFETVWNSTDGVFAKVTKVNKSAFLQVGEKVFIRSSTQLGNRFRVQVYAAGCMMDLDNELLRVLALDENSAVNIAWENILSAIGGKYVLSDSAVKNTNTPVVQNIKSGSAVQPVVNNFYISEDDDENDQIYIIRDGRRYRKPGVRPPRPADRPAVRPENKPSVTVPGNRPGNNRPANKDNFSKNKSVIQRDDKKIHSYDHLPDWALPRYSRP